MKFFWIWALVTLVQGPQYLQAQTRSLQYPELMVVPRATDLLAREVKHEKKKVFSRLKWVQFAALSNMAVSYRAMQREGVDETPDDAVAGLAGMAISGSTLLISLGLDFLYTPYRSGQREISKIRTKGQRGYLEKQRYGEQVLQGAASMSRRMAWLSFLGTGGTALAMVGTTDDPTIKLLGGLSAVLSTIPLMINSHYEDQWCHYSKSKKRIYGPISSLGVAPYKGQDGSLGLAPVWSLSIKI